MLKRITRLIVIEGDVEWVNAVIGQSAVQWPGASVPIKTDRCVVRCLSRMDEVVPETAAEKKTVESERNSHAPRS